MILKHTLKILGLNFLIIAALTTHAQTRIMVEHDNNTSIYDNIEAALANAPSGASVYLPGGRFELDTLKKELHLYGLGYLKINEAQKRRNLMIKNFGKANHFMKGKDLLKAMTN